MKLAAGIMITASHNPKQDNGYKLYWDNGCQIISPVDSEVSKRIMQNLAIWDNVDITCDSLKNNPLIEQNSLAKVIDSYYHQIEQLYCYEKQKNQQSKVHFTYTAMHGVGAKWTERAFEVFGLPDFIGVEAQLEPNPDFPTVAYPNPEEGKGALKLAMETADKHGSRLILANDPDADRLAVAEKQQEYVVFM
jgi:phosphomannomutase